jgi:hypothetical protein
MQKLSGEWGGLEGPLSRSAGEAGWGAPPGNPVTTPFPCFLSTERVCSEAKQGLSCEIRTISQGREKAEKGMCGGGTLRTSPAGTGERHLEEGHGGAVPLHGSAAPFLTNGACTLFPYEFDAPDSQGYNEQPMHGGTLYPRAELGPGFGLDL